VRQNKVSHVLFGHSPGVLQERSQKLWFARLKDAHGVSVTVVPVTVVPVVALVDVIVSDTLVALVVTVVPEPVDSVVVYVVGIVLVVAVVPVLVMLVAQNPQDMSHKCAPVQVGQNTVSQLCSSDWQHPSQRQSSYLKHDVVVAVVVVVPLPVVRV
jgi:hypothetical protein